MVRAFIALELTPEIQEQLGEIQNQLEQAAADVKWVNPQGIHLTLKFLGNVSLELIEEIKKVINQLVKEHQSFQLNIKQLGAFPKIEYPRVIWVGIDRGKDETIRLAQDLEENLLQLGFLKEKRPFKAHLTLGRVRSAQKRPQLKELLQTVTFPARAMQAQTLTLFQSTLTPKGAIYQPLHQAKLT